MPLPDRRPERRIVYLIADRSGESFLSLRVKFYLGDRPDPAGGGGKIEEYSDYVALTLQPR